jgi:stage II sporulation protein D
VGYFSEGARLQGRFVVEELAVGLIIRGGFNKRMYKKLFFIQILIILLSGISSGQVRIRLFAGQPAVSGVLTVAEGKYELDIFDGKPVPLTVGDPVILAIYDNKIAVKIRNSLSFMCDSLIVNGLTEDSRFSFRVDGSRHDRQIYSGDLRCHPDLGILVFINICDFEQYIAGVVRTEGGTGRNIEYLKSQAVLARTFMYRHFNRHSLDNYNLCDETHCQAFHGITTDTLIIRAAFETKGLVALDRDSVLIISAFHSNCGGETSTSESVWLSGHSSVRKVIDPYCVNSPNARWRKTIPLREWEAYLKKSGFIPGANTPPSYNFSQLTRQGDYRVGSFSLPFSRIRNDFNLKSAFFSVQQEGNSVILKGRGYGHGVGLCQEGAMVMADRGFKFRDIIRFYYPDIIITDFKYAKVVKNDL